MGSLDSGATHREYLLGALERDDINWELKSSIRALLGYADSRDKDVAAYRELEAKNERLRKELALLEKVRDSIVRAMTGRSWQLSPELEALLGDLDGRETIPEKETT